MTDRVVTATILRADNSPWVGGVVSFLLDKGSYTATEEHPRDIKTATANNAGQISIELWVNSEGIIPTKWICTHPSGESFEFILPAGTSPVSLSWLRSQGVSLPPGGEAGNIVATLIDTHNNDPAAHDGDLQPANELLSAIAALTTAADQLIYAIGPDQVALTALTTFARSLLAATNAAAARSGLELGTMAIQNANNVAITGGSIAGATLDPRGCVIAPLSGVSTLDALRVAGDFSGLLRVPVHNQNASGSVDFAVMSGPDPGYAMLKSSILGFQPGTTDRAFHDYRSDNANFQVERRVQGGAIDRFDRATNTYSLLTNTIANITGGTVSGISSLGVSANLDGLLRSTINNQSSGANARTDFVQQIGGSTARSTIWGIRQISGSDTAFIDSRGNLPFQFRLSYAENIFFSYDRSASAIALRLGAEAGTDIGIGGAQVANYKTTFSGESSKHTALFRSVSGSLSIAQFWNASNGSVLGIFPTYIQTAAPLYLSTTYTLATLPFATTVGGIVYCSNLTGGAEFVFSDGTNWRRMSDRTIAN